MKEETKEILIKCALCLLAGIVHAICIGISQCGRSSSQRSYRSGGYRAKRRR